MRILYIQVGGAPFDIFTTLIRMGHQVDTINEAVNEFSVSNEALLELELKFKENRYDFLISYQFVCSISDLCEKYKVRYAAWIYDSPCMSLFSESAKNAVNFFFVFDRKEAERISELGYERVIHFPLGANADRTGSIIITDEDKSLYSSDVSFVGKIYSNSARDQIIDGFDDDDKSYIREWTRERCCNWRVERCWPSVTSGIRDYMLRQPTFNYEECGCMPPELYLGNLMTRDLAGAERSRLIKELSEVYPVDLYTYDRPDNLGRTRIHPPVDYMNTLSKVYFLSKINLNITMPSIETGVPLRIFDIMACGGFVLTNAQPELYELFDVGREIEIYHDLEELKYKVGYYLSHEQERINIGINGYKKVVGEYSIEKKLGEIIEIMKMCE